MKVIITGGGTGGHLIPAVELYKYFVKKNDNVLLVASKNGNDQQIIESLKHKINVKYYDIKGFRRKKSIINLCINFLNMLKLCGALVKSFILLKREKPDLIVGTGGYVEFPLVYMATKLNIKTIIYEQNSYPGIANKILGKKVDKIGFVFEGAKEYFPSEKLFFGSNPSVLRLNETIVCLPNEYNLLFVGGSLGSEIINEYAYNYANIFPKQKIKLIAGTGKYNFPDLSNLEVVSFEKDIIQSFVQSEIIISRAGASTLTEMITLNKKIIAIPSPNVVADHQTKNCLEFSGHSNFEMIKEKELNMEVLIESVEKLKTMKDVKKLNEKYMDVIHYLESEVMIEH